MELIIKNCNSIDVATIKIEEGKLNIKYGINGTGKSTIAKAIELHIKGNDNIKELTPFKYRVENSAEIPSITGIENISSVAIFNDNYINQFAFKPDEVVANSFEIFIKNQEYNSKMQEIENIILDIKETFKNNTELEQVIKDLEELSDCFGKSNTGFSKAGSIGKGLGKGNKIENIPTTLTIYSAYLKNPDNVKWIDWHINGSNFSNIVDSSCPYCTSSTLDKKENIESVKKEYEPNAIKHLNKVLSVLERLDKYFADSTKEKLVQITKNSTDLSKEEIGYLVDIKRQIDTLIEKLNDLKEITFFSFANVDKVIEKIKSLKIDINLLSHLDSEETLKIVNSMNQALERVLSQAGKLQGEINKQKKLIKETIENYKNEINDFLRFAGYKYSVDIENEGKEYKMKLKHLDFSENVSSGTQHLSYGEKNAFSLVLFMYENLAKKPDLIILDDPISSFDKNKKFAIIEMLFRGENSFRGKTVLMMTHDLEPIIDMVKNLSHIFQPVPVASFLKSTNGVVNEIAITRSDIITFAQVCDDNVASQSNNIIKLIYLRRYYEVVNDKGNEYQLISNLLHKRETPVKRVCEAETIMTYDEINQACDNIKEKISDFDYSGILPKLKDTYKMKQLYENSNSNYEKLQIFRIFCENHENDVVKKYINEAFHIENEYIMQLNPLRYEVIPDFIIAECNKSLPINV